jgi:hypothetical protein
MSTPTPLDDAATAAIRTRCEALGLSLEDARRLASENDAADPHSLPRVLGLDLLTLQPIKERRWLAIAAQNASVSYRTTLTEDALRAALVIGTVPEGCLSHICHVLDEAPLQLVVLAVEQAAQQSGMPIRETWRNVERLAATVCHRRPGVWRFTGLGAQP